MYKHINKILTVLLAVHSVIAFAQPVATTRIPYFTKDKVIAWQTIIYPDTKQKLQWHRHDNNRVVVAFDGGTLKITNNKGAVHYLTLVRQKAYYLMKDPPGELHTDENVSDKPINVAVIEIR